MSRIQHVNETGMAARAYEVRLHDMRARIVAEERAGRHASQALP